MELISMTVPNFQHRPLQTVFDDQGMLTVKYQIVPGHERRPQYWFRQAQIKQNSPQSRQSRVTRLPMAGEEVPVGSFLWRVRRVIHLPVEQYADPDDLFYFLPVPVTIVQVSFVGMLNPTS